MALIVPNAADTTGGNKYAALDQSEPDALDFEILSYADSGVLSGCEVTSNNSASDVSVSSGVIALGGATYTVVGSASLALPSAPSDNRFDIVVARVTAGTASLYVVSGDNSATNPSFPRSASVLTGSPALSTNVNFATDVVLAALFRSGAGVVTGSRITDKRKTVHSSIPNQGASAPSNGVGFTGSLYYKSGAPAGPSSGVYVKASDGVWYEVARNVGPHLPVGGTILWPSQSAVPTNFGEANGQALSTTTYADLFAQYGYIHGGSGGSFFLPNYNDKFIRGTTTPSNVGSAGVGGANTVTLSTANLPVHAHTLASHTHSYAHTHGIDHTHGATSTGAAGAHWHDVLPPSGAPGGLAQGSAMGSGIWGVSSIYARYGSRNGQQVMTDTEESHTHTIPAMGFSGSTSSQNTSTSGGPSVANTGDAGSGTSFSILPSFAYGRWIIRLTY